MNEIARGTTPTIRFTFKTIDPSEIVTAYLTLKQNSETIIEKDISSAETGADYIEWKLPQDETKTLDSRYPVQVQCRYKVGDGTVYASRIYTERVYDILKEDVI